ncbi:arylesterase [Kordiimonas aestuarii]|uniref:arylesterase n=1 Tax=Kordiimonas aestuarii TaxID=1005925 RepID=UPI0021D17DE2|nr:arylesterase [Kordiimonas aestuarii]
MLEIVAFGDSLTAGYGLAPGEGFTDQLQAWLDDNMTRGVRVINAGVSGDTSSGGRARLDWGLAPVKDGKPDLVILELGANDGLRGIDPTITAENIDAMVKELAEREVTVLIAGMMAPPNLGGEYARVFNPIYKEAAEKYDMPLYPFFLDGVAADASLNQSDGMHPNAEGVKIVVDKIGPVVKKLLAE